jgi:hypothetical protein
MLHTRSRKASELPGTSGPTCRGLVSQDGGSDDEDTLDGGGLGLI